MIVKFKIVISFIFFLFLLNSTNELKIKTNSLTQTTLNAFLSYYEQLSSIKITDDYIEEVFKLTLD